MKKLILFSLMIVSHFSFAQPDKENNKKYKWGCAVAINSVEGQLPVPWQSILTSSFNSSANKTDKSISLSIIPKYFIRDDIAFRFEFGITNIQYKYNQNIENSFYDVISNRTLNSKIYRYIPGVQWRFLNKKIIDFNIGATIYYTHYSKAEYVGYSETRQMPNDTITDWSNDETTFIGGYATGIGILFGSNIYLNEHISLGAEISSALIYNKIGGSYNSHYTTQSPPNPPVSDNLNTSSNLYKGFQFAKLLTSYNLSIWF